MSRLWKYMIGAPSEFSLEERIYHAVCILGLAGAAYNIPFNFLVNLPVSGWLSIIIFIALAFLYYLSRFKNKSEISFVAASLLINALLAVNFCYNSGADGPTLILYALIFFLTMAVAPKKRYLIWTILNITLVVSLLSIQYLHPDWISYTYPSRFSRFTDIVSAYIVVIVLVYTGTYYIRKNYEKERKKAENRALEMERLNKEKNKLFSIISHDLRMPLATVQHYLELLNEVELGQKEKQQFENELLQITRNTQEMLSNLLFWSKAQMDGQRTHLTKTEIYQALEQAVKVQLPSAARKEINLNYTAAENAAQVNVLADRDMLQLILRNLISNAIKFTPQGKTIDIDVSTDMNRCQISIKDNGSGIPAEKQKDIFSLKASSTYGTENEKGVGLGLVLCKDFINAQKGNIWFESSAETGTTFYIALLLYKKEKEETLN